MKLQIQRFDARKIKPGRITLLVGKRGTGKSTLMEDIMFRIHPTIEWSMAMTPTFESAEMFKRHMSYNFVYEQYAATVMERVVDTQRSLMRKKKQKQLLVALDDCLYDKTILKSRTIREVFMNGRHMSLTVLIACQYIMDMGPDLRSQVDYVFALRENIISNRQRLWKYFFGMLGKYEDFARLMDACTENYTCLVLDNTVKSNKLEDCIFWYRAEPSIPHFTIGIKAVEDLTQRFLRKEQSDDERAVSNGCHQRATTPAKNAPWVSSVERMGDEAFQ